MRIEWLVNETHFERAMALRNSSHLPTTQCTCVDFATQRNGGGCEKDLYTGNMDIHIEQDYTLRLTFYPFPFIEEICLGEICFF
jgi:hypothetical protein